MKKAVEQLREFHTVYNCGIGEKAEFPNSAVRLLRQNLLEEEFGEYIEAEYTDDFVEVADALADMLYVIIGTAINYGIPIAAVFDEVHASNMSKVDGDGNPIRRKDGKVLKGPNYFRPNIPYILDTHKDV